MGSGIAAGIVKRHMPMDRSGGKLMLGVSVVTLKSCCLLWPKASALWYKFNCTELLSSTWGCQGSPISPPKWDCSESEESILYSRGLFLSPATSSLWALSVPSIRLLHAQFYLISLSKIETNALCSFARPGGSKPKSSKMDLNRPACLCILGP